VSQQNTTKEKQVAKQKLSFRQQLRADSEKQLDGMIEQALEAGDKITKGTSVDSALLLQLASQPTHGKTLRHTLITKLANDREAELQRIYNDQMALPGVDDD
jgi:hypothetical protein